MLLALSSSNYCINSVATIYATKMFNFATVCVDNKSNTCP